MCPDSYRDYCELCYVVNQFKLIQKLFHGKNIVALILSSNLKCFNHEKSFLYPGRL